MRPRECKRLVPRYPARSRETGARTSQSWLPGQRSFPSGAAGSGVQRGAGLPRTDRRGCPGVTCVGPRPGMQQSDLRPPLVAAGPAPHHLSQEQPHAPSRRAALAAGRPEEQKPGLHGTGGVAGPGSGSRASRGRDRQREGARREGQEAAPRRVRRKLLPPARRARRCPAGRDHAGGGILRSTSRGSLDRPPGADRRAGVAEH